MQHSEGTFPGVRNATIYYQNWLPDGAVKAVLLVVHGLGGTWVEWTRSA